MLKRVVMNVEVPARRADDDGVAVVSVWCWSDATIGEEEVQNIAVVGQGVLQPRGQIYMGAPNGMVEINLRAKLPP